MSPPAIVVVKVYQAIAVVNLYPVAVLLPASLLIYFGCKAIALVAASDKSVVGAVSEAGERRTIL
jgi:hypothetical protein